MKIHKMTGSPVTRILAWLLAGALFFLIVFLLWSVLQWQLAGWRSQIGHTGSIQLKDLIKLEGGLLSGWVQLLWVAAFGLGLYLAWRAYRLNRDGQITSQFSRAIRHLAYTNALEVRLGGIFALERIAQDSAKDHSPIMEVLTAYVREHAPRAYHGATVRSKAGDKNPEMRLVSQESGLATDIQAVLTVIGRRECVSQETHHLNLTNTNLKGAYLPGADLQRADLTEADLQEANLTGANLDWAYLHGTSLEGASLIGSHLQGASLIGATLQAAYLHGADLQEADLRGADLRGANFRGANLQGADFRHANLQDVAWGNELDATGITQISKARTLFEAVMPTELRQQVQKLCPRLLAPLGKTVIGSS